MKIRINKLIEIQSKLVVGKPQFNKFGNYAYRSAEDILNAVKPLLKEQGLALTVTDSIELIGDRFYVKATATLFDNETKEEISNCAYARESSEKKGMDSSQVTGATSSYARKYALNGLFLLDDVKDADTMDNSQDNTPKASAKQIELLKELTKDYEEDQLEKSLSKYGVKIFEELNINQASEIIGKLKW